jgi:hypothetical protein
MARFSNEIRQHEVRAYEQFCIEHDIVLDGSESAIANANLVRDYFTKTWSEVISPETLEKAFSHLRPHLKFKSKAQLEFEKLASQEPDRASQLDSWLQAHGGKPGQLVNSVYSDDTYENLTVLLTELRNRREEVSLNTIRDAENRIAHRPGKQLHRVPQPRKEMGAISEAARDEGAASAEWKPGRSFLGELVKNPDGSFRSKTPQEQRRDAEAAERAKSQPQTRTLDASDQAWKSIADGLLADGTHSQQQRVRAVYDREQGNGWRRIYEACQREINLYKNRGVR